MGVVRDVYMGAKLLMGLRLHLLLEIISYGWSLGCLRQGFVAWSLECGTTYAHLRTECAHQCPVFGASLIAYPSEPSTLVSPRALMWGGVGVSAQVLVETDRQRSCISTTAVTPVDLAARLSSTH